MCIRDSTYLVELLKRNHYNLEEMAHAETYADVLNSIYGDEDPLPVIFQMCIRDRPPSIPKTTCPKFHEN